MIDIKEIDAFIQSHDYDIRKSHNARWIDQKCTPDVICIIADCIIQYVNKNDNRFTVKDIWKNKYTVDNVIQIFSKPNPMTDASNEYDKYFGQPIKLLDASGVLTCERRGRSYVYSILDYDVLEFISFRERNALLFLCSYIEKVLQDSGLSMLFNDFFKLQNKDSFKKLKDGFAKFTIDNTPINKTTECYRIFTKILNPLSYSKQKRAQ